MTSSTSPRPSETKTRIEKLLKDASADTQAVITDVFKIERERLYEAHPRKVPQEIVAAIKLRIQ